MLTPPPIPTIYYTTTNGTQISDVDTRLQDYIVSHTKTNDGEWKIVLKDTMTSIPDQCFYYQSTLTSIRFDDMDNVTSIGTSFLAYCSGLQSIGLSPLSNVTSIGGSFLSNCSSLQTLTMPNTTEIKTIGTNYLNRCTKLTKIYCPKGTLEFYKGLMPTYASKMIEMD